MKSLMIILYYMNSSIIFLCTIFNQSIEFTCYLNSHECDFQDEFPFDSKITHEFIYFSVRWIHMIRVIRWNNWIHWLYEVIHYYMNSFVRWIHCWFSFDIWIHLLSFFVQFSINQVNSLVIWIHVSVIFQMNSHLTVK